jgi:hypothetical protein
MKNLSWLSNKDSIEDWDLITPYFRDKLAQEKMAWILEPATVDALKTRSVAVPPQPVAIPPGGTAVQFQARKLMWDYETSLRKTILGENKDASMLDIPWASLSLRISSIRRVLSTAGRATTWY